MEHLISHVATLQNHEAVHRLLDRAKDGCMKWITQSIDDGDLQGMKIEDLEIHFVRNALIFSSGLVSYPFFETKLEVIATNRPNKNLSGGFECVAQYRLITGLDGSDVDDYFVVENR